ncbi:MAG: CHRD domain-containing protein [Micromonosporaceae bacterium]|nr:CHRD domain-containing protein [Micromonosporaceae bacterium]
MWRVGHLEGAVMSRRSGRLLSIATAIATATAAVVAGSLLAQPAAAHHQCSESLIPAPKTGTLVASCIDSGQVVDPPGSDSPGQGAATIWIDMNQDQIAFEVHTVGLTLPIHGSIVHEGDVGDPGPERFTLFGRIMEENPTGCSGMLDPELRDLLQKSKPFYLEIYDDLWRDGAIRGQLEYVDQSGSPPPGVCGS